MEQRNQVRGLRVRDSGHKRASLEALCCEWVSTPWMSGQRFKTVGVDCVNFCMAIWDGLFSKQSPVLSMRFDEFRYEDKGFYTEVMKLMAHHPCDSILPGRDGVISLEDGDVILTKSKNSGPEHALIVVGSKCYGVDRISGVIDCCLPPPEAVYTVYRRRP